MVCLVVDTPSTLPPFVNWPSFPFEGQLRTKRLDPPVSVEPPREGEEPGTCVACKATDDAYIWVSDGWRVRAMERPTGLPMVLILESRSHLDLGDLPNLLAAELGVMVVQLERAIRSLEGVARVHVNRWGDGSAHLHLWFFARPVGQLQLRGSFLSLWDDILEPVPEERWRKDLAHVAAWLAEFGGQALAEPPRIEWHAPSNFAEQIKVAAKVDVTPATADTPTAADAVEVSDDATPTEAVRIPAPRAEADGYAANETAASGVASQTAGTNGAEVAGEGPLAETIGGAVLVDADRQS